MHPRSSSPLKNSRRGSALRAIEKNVFALFIQIIDETKHFEHSNGVFMRVAIYLSIFFIAATAAPSYAAACGCDNDPAQTIAITTEAREFLIANFSPSRSVLQRPDDKTVRSANLAQLNPYAPLWVLRVSRETIETVKDLATRGLASMASESGDEVDTKRKKDSYIFRVDESGKASLVLSFQKNISSVDEKAVHELIGEISAALQKKRPTSNDAVEWGRDEHGIAIEVTLVLAGERSLFVQDQLDRFRKNYDDNEGRKEMKRVAARAAEQSEAHHFAPAPAAPDAGAIHTPVTPIQLPPPGSESPVAIAE
jgi:hypothetical protein